MHSAIFKTFTSWSERKIIFSLPGKAAERLGWALARNAVHSEEYMAFVLRLSRLQTIIMQFSRHSVKRLTENQIKKYLHISSLGAAYWLYDQ
jgi:hypothetical protein